MMTTELSAIQRNSVQSSRLAAAVCEFQRSGGAVRDLGSFRVAPRPPRKEPPPRQPRYNGADHRKYVEEEEDLKLLECIKAMRDLGVSHFQAEKQTGINRTTIRRIVSKYDLHYPSSKRSA
ncbi:hypothetical protein [Pseudomonas syringae]|uniref:hypothetical protein n=1 Tax=Pseudomonas syringae TaxID=317 RepID=UPI000E314333|nr:hypothetical protein [Pseudomonas syringae]